MSLKRSSSLIFLIFIILILSNSNSISLEKKIFNFNDGNLKKFKKHSIKGETNYEIIKENNNAYLKAKASGTASGLGVEKKIDLNETPFLNISWKLEKGLIGINEKSKKGHDFALRVFVIKSTGRLPWKKKVINYVFSSNEIKQSSWTSPYTKQSVDYVLSSLKDDKQNKWISVKTNVKEDFQTIHKLNVNKIDGIAIMTDTDNSKQEAIGYYKDIYFSSK